MQINSNSKKLAILAPVEMSYLKTAIYRVYPYHNKVAFGADKVNEMKIIRDDFLKAKKIQKDVNVYICASDSIKYKAILVDEFILDNQVKKRHPDPWGWWNKDFKSYYTVKNVKACNLPLNSFKSFQTDKIIEHVERPLKVIDPQ